MDGVAFRTAVPDDAGEIAQTVALAFRDYREIAPPDWAPPPVEPEAIRVRLRNPNVWCQVAEDAGRMAGHVALIPAALHASYPLDDPSLAHLWQLFVRQEDQQLLPIQHFSSGVLAEARARGYSTFRLYTPAAQLRARGFYEREGWHAVGEAFTEPSFGGIELIEYRRSLA